MSGRSGRSRVGDSWTRTTLLALLLIALGQLIEASDGHYSVEGIRWLLLATVLSGLALWARPIAALERLEVRTPVAVLLTGLVLQFSQLLTRPPGVYLRPVGGWTTFLAAMAAAAVLAGSLAYAGPAWARLGAALVSVCFLAASLWLLRASPRPAIDVFVFHQQSIDVLLKGQNPYSVTFPNIYGNTQFYGPGVANPTTVFIGFPYPPLSLFLATLGVVVAGDYRGALALGLVVAAACLVAVRPDRLGGLTAAALLFTPRVFFVLEQGWTEAFGVALLAVVVLAALRAPRLLWVALGALFAWKQHMVVLLPLTLLLVPQPFTWKAWMRLAIPAVLLTVGLTLPLALWDLSGFWRSVVWFQTVQPFRTDALTFPAALVALGATPPPVMLTELVLTALAVGLTLWKAPRSPSGFALAVTVVFGVFFAFSKQSFCNYWFFVLGAAAIATAAGTTRSSREVAAAV